jgi:ubiquinone biosynthesis protein UbiJ
MLAALNFAIERDRALHDQLRSLAGCHIAIGFEGFSPLTIPALSARFAPDGLLEAVSTESSVPIDVRLTLTPAFFVASLEQVLSQPSAGPSMRGLRIEGDVEIAQRLTPLIALMRARISPLGQALQRSWPAQAAQKAAHYAIFETNVLVSRGRMDSHQQDLHALRDRIARLEKRLQSVEATSAR